MLQEAQRIVEEKSDFGPLADNWRVQKAYEEEWALPAIWVMQALQPCKVLDVGPGYGTLAVAAQLLGHEVTAVDLFVPPPAVPGIRWVKDNIQKPGAVPKGPFGLVVMTEVLEHLCFRPAPLFAGLYLACEVGAQFVGSTPVPEIWEETFVVPRYELLPEWGEGKAVEDAHMAAYSMWEVAGLLKGAGFAVVEQRKLGRGWRHWWRAEVQDKDPQRLCTEDGKL